LKAGEDFFGMRFNVDQLATFLATARTETVEYPRSDSGRRFAEPPSSTTFHAARSNPSASQLSVASR
jgi:hypothetical protein